MNTLTSSQWQPPPRHNLEMWALPGGPVLRHLAWLDWEPLVRGGYELRLEGASLCTRQAAYPASETVESGARRHLRQAHDVALAASQVSIRSRGRHLVSRPFLVIRVFAPVNPINPSNRLTVAQVQSLWSMTLPIEKITFETRLGFIGLGYMGSRIARRLAAAGFPMV